MLKNKYFRLFISFLLITSILISCDKDDETNHHTIQFTENGLQVGIPPVVSDTIVANSNMNIELVNGTIDNINISNIYELELQGGGSFSRVKKGTTIIDNNNGRLWVVKEVVNENNGAYRVNAFPGMLGNLFQNAIIKASYNDNRAKQNSQYPHKLISNQVTLNAFDEDFLWYVNPDDVSNQNSQLPNNTSLSVNNDGNIIIDLNDFTLIDVGGSDLKITEGTLTLKPAVDTEMKFNPTDVILDFANPLSITAGSIKDFKSAIYLSADFDVTLGGNVNIINLSSNIPLTNFIIVVPVGCCAFIELELDVSLKTTLNAEANFNLLPRFKSKNDFVATVNYEGLGTLPNFDLEFNNLENTPEINENYNINSNLKFEFVPKASVYLYGLIGPSAELTPYLNLSASLDLDGTNNISTWDARVDYGLDSRLALDINVLGETSWIENNEIGVQEIAEIFNENIYEENLYKAPKDLTITLGNNQTGQTNTQLNNLVEIEVKDNLGNPLSDVYVFFETNDGSFTENYVLSNAIGLVANTWVLGSDVGEQTATAYVKDGSGNIIQNSEITITAIAENTATINPVNTPIPTDGATDIPLSGNISFTEGANTPANATFKVYFDTNTDPSIVYNLDANTNTLSYSNLQEGTQYYWKVETISSTGSILATSQIWSFTTENNSSGGVYDGNVNLVTQQEVDDFGANNYSEITGFLSIGNSTTGATNINNLNALSTIVSIGGDLTIYNNDSLNNLSGLSSINNIGGWLLIRFNDNLTNIDALNNIATIGNVLSIKDNPALININGFNLLSTLGGSLMIQENSSLNNINGFSIISEINGVLEINTNINLVSINAFSSLTSIENYLFIGGNDNLTQLSSFNTLISTGNSLEFIENESLTDITGFNNLSSIGGRLFIDNDNLTNINGFNSLVDINDDLNLIGPNISIINAFSNLESIGNKLNIGGNQISDIDFLMNITNIGGDLFIGGTSITNLNSLNNLANIGGNLSVSYNTLLNDFCGITNVINNGFNGNYSVANNAYNPTQQDIIDGNCSQ